MSRIYDSVFFGDSIVPMDRASVSIASSAVLYGLSVYTVFPIAVKGSERYEFRLTDHFRRLVNSAKIIGIDTFMA